MKTADISAVLTSAQLVLSMIETRRAARNGDGPGPAAPQELERIERQLGKLESLDGQSADVRREIEDLRQRVTALRNEMSHREAWVRTELARHPQRPYFLDYVEKIFTEFSEIHGDRRFAGHPGFRSCTDDGERDLFCYFSRGLRFHHVARRFEERIGCRGLAYYCL